MMIVVLSKVVKIKIASIHVQMEIHAVEQLNAVQIIIELFARAHRDTLVIHLLTAISNQV